MTAAGPAILPAEAWQCEEASSRNRQVSRAVLQSATSRRRGTALSRASRYLPDPITGSFRLREAPADVSAVGQVPEGINSAGQMPPGVNLRNHPDEFAVRCAPHLCSPGDACLSCRFLSPFVSAASLRFVSLTRLAVLLPCCPGRHSSEPHISLPPALLRNCVR